MLRGASGTTVPPVSLLCIIQAVPGSLRTQELCNEIFWNQIGVLYASLLPELNPAVQEVFSGPAADGLAFATGALS